MSQKVDIFVVRSSVDLGIGEIALTTSAADHIRKGHRDISFSLHTAVRDVLEKPTEVYNGNEVARYVFFNTGVARKEKPLAVVVESTGARAEVVTATWHGGTMKAKIWSGTSQLYSHHDKDHDIVYISTGPAEDAYAEEDRDDPQIWYRRRFSDDGSCGVTIFDVQKRLLSLDAIYRKASDFLGVAEAQIRDRISSALTEKNA